MSSASVVRPRSQVKPPGVPPVVFSQAEVTRLVQALTEGRTAITEADVLVFLQWCQAQRMGALLVRMILNGELRPTVRDGQVVVGLRDQAVMANRD